MGCTYTHPRNGDVDPRIFKVLNVDSEGQERNPGKIEITESELILHQKGKNPIRWPLRSLRRYGFDAELFSFESGRRCPTGEGIYAFQCQRAEALFNLLQECIQRAGQDDPTAPPVNINQAALHIERPVLHTLDSGPSNPFWPAPHSTNASGVSNPAVNRSVSQNAADGVVSLQVFPTVPSAHEYINTDNFQSIHGEHIQRNGDTVDLSSVALRMNSTSSRRSSGGGMAGGSEPRIQYAQLDLQQSSIDTHLLPSAAESESSQAMYINVPSQAEMNGKQTMAASVSSTNSCAKVGPPLLKVSSVVEEQQHEYLNLDLNGPKKCPPPPNHRSKQPTIELEPHAEPKITYIEVDFKSPDEGPSSANGGNRIANGGPGGDAFLSGGALGPLGRSGSCHGDTVPPLKTESYAVIDFNKTAAINAKNTNARDDEGVRKTRHNSSIDELQ